MNIEIKTENEVLTMIIKGEVDTITANEFEAKIQEVLAADYKQVVVDCSEMEYISSSGLRGFLILQKGMITKGGKCVVRSLTDFISELFKITGFSAILTVE